MKHTFFLKNPQRDRKTKKILSNDETLILFSCYFKEEKKQFTYSTGENIKPKEWNFEENNCYTKGRFKSSKATEINLQLSRYTSTFEKVFGMYIKMGENFTSLVLKSALNKEFKKVDTGKTDFFEAYNIFLEEKKKRKEWKTSTNGVYNNLKNILKKFETERKYKITFSTINVCLQTNLDFYIESI